VLVRGDENSSISLRLITRQFVDLRQNEEMGLNSLSAALNFYLEELEAQEARKYEEDQSQSATQTAQLRREQLEQVARFEAEKADLQRQLSEARQSKTSDLIERESARRENEEQGAKRRTAGQNSNRMYLLGGFIVIAAVISAVLFSKLTPQVRSTKSFIAAVSEQLLTSTIAVPSNATSTSEAVSTTTPTITPIPYPAVITDYQGIEMVLIPAGEFTMGSDAGNGDNRPPHKVYLDSYYIDRFEVTVLQYKACAATGVCKAPAYTGHYNDAQYSNHPITNVDWYMANTYCQQREARLPTEAEWEKAARGSDGRTYPWGEDINSTLANYNNTIGDTAAVGSYEQGKSPYGIYDMAGNVWEWVSDWFDGNYYPASPYSNPTGPSSGQDKVLRGGSLDNQDWGVSTYFRNPKVPTYNNGDIGFRCARFP
jgi:formylglycine-generating enzyme required for sulfatase activity